MAFEWVAPAVQTTLGDGIVESITMRLGNPALAVSVNRIDVPVTETNGVGMVWVHDITGEGGITMAENTGAYPLQTKDKIFGRYVQVKKTRDRLQVVGFAREDAGYMYGVNLAEQVPVSIALFSWGLLQPTEPRSMKAFLTQAIYGGQYLVRAQETQDFTADIPATAGEAIAVLIEVDPTTGILAYTNGSAFDATLTHENAFASYPKSADSTLYTAGWIRLENGMTAILEGKHVYPAQELLSKGVGAAGADRPVSRWIGL